MFKAQRDSYLYADYPGVFDVVEGDGVTVEAWIYLTERPGDRDLMNGNWLIVAKPGSYVLTISGRDRGSGIDMSHPRGTTWARFKLQQQPRPNGLASTSSLLAIHPEEFPLRRWVHVGFQLTWEKYGIPNSWFYDRTIYYGYGNEMGRTAAPLLIGGSTLLTFREGYEWGHEYESIKGYIDEVHVSKGFRYDPKGGKKIRPRRHFRPDAQTIAQWRFEEGPGSDIYRDSSGNGYHLFPGGSLAVEARDKLATTWGSLKR